MALVEQVDHALPATPVPLARLTAFAVGFRYADMPPSEVLDPGEARATVATLRQYVEARIEEIAKARQSPSSSA